MKDEQGSVLVEVLVSAILITVAAIGVFNALDSASRSTAQERHRAQAHGLAQADLARMRTMRISDLSNFDESRQIVVDGIPYTVDSDAEFKEDGTVTPSCQAGEADEADYLLIRSRVTWPSIGARPPVETQSLVAPPNGSISAERGALAIQIEDARSDGVEGAVLSGVHEKGEGSFSGSTGPSGCRIFGNLADGNYTLTISPPPLVSELIDRFGNPPEQQPTSVVAEGTNTLVLQYDEPGTIEIGFETWVDGEVVETSFDSILAFNSNLISPRPFVSSSPAPVLQATKLFPFESQYVVFAGSCDGNDPSAYEGPESEGNESSGVIAEALVTPGDVTPVQLRLPALDLTVWSGSGPGQEERGDPVQGANVVVTDELCKDAEEESIQHTYTTNASGGLDDPGLPFGRYTVCVEHEGKRITETDVDLPEDPAQTELGTPIAFFLGHPEVGEGSCP